MAPCRLASSGASRSRRAERGTEARGSNPRESTPPKSTILDDFRRSRRFRIELTENPLRFVSETVPACSSLGSAFDADVFNNHRLWGLGARTPAAVEERENI